MSHNTPCSATTANPAQHAARLIGLPDATASAASAAAALATAAASSAAVHSSVHHIAAPSNGADYGPSGLPPDDGCRPWWWGDCDGKAEELVLITEVSFTLLVTNMK